MNTSDFVIWSVGVAVTAGTVAVALAVYRLGDIVKAIWAEHKRYDV